MIEQLPLYNKLLIILIDLIGIWLAFLVYRNNSKEKINKIFLVMVGLMFAWVNFAYFARLVGEDQIALSSLFLKIAWFATPLLFVFLYFLVVYLLQKEKEYQFLSKIILITGISIALITGFTDLIVKNIKFINGDLTIIYGVGMLPFLGIVFFFMCAPLYILFKSYFKFLLKERIKIQYLLVGILIFYSLNIVFNIFLPLVLNIVRFYWIGDYSAIFLLGFTAYAIIKHELFEIKVILTQLLVAVMAITLLLLPFFMPTTGLMIITAGMAILFLIFGYLLTKSTFREIKQRKKLEVAYQKLKKLDDAKTEFLSMASHQLRTPLTAIKGYSSLMLGGSYGELNPKTTKAARNILTSSERLVKIINDLLNLSRIEMGRLKLEVKLTQVEDLIKSVYEEMKPRAKLKEIKLIWNKPKILSPKINIDGFKIRQVIYNLIDNALKYTEKGSITMDIKKLKDRIQITVSDTGVGFSPEDKDKIFEVFTKGQAGIDMSVEGTGMGLYIAKKFVEIHKGRMWAESPGPNKGSTFYIELPVR